MSSSIAELRLLVSLSARTVLDHRFLVNQDLKTAREQTFALRN